MKHIFGLAILLSAFCLSALAQDDSCARSGWVTDNDPVGTNIRDTASLKGKVIGKIPKATTDGGQAMLDIIGYSNGWLKIRLAESVDGTTFFKGTGWISAKKVTANVETNTGKPAQLYSLPKRSSRKVGAVPSETTISIVGFDCFGFKVSCKGKMGWLATDDICGNPVTTCP